MKYRIQILIAILLLQARSDAQYRVGTSTVSLEPDSSIFSLALGGYGAPAEGRFTITWSFIADVPSIKDICGVGGNLYAVTKGNELLRGAISQQDVLWQTLGVQKDIETLGSVNTTLFCVNNKRELLEGQLSSTAVKWKKIESFNGSIVALGGLKGVLYAASDGNRLLEKNMDSKKKWITRDSISNVSGLTSDGERLYLAKRDSTIWYRKTTDNSGQWIKIGRYNGFTYKINVRKMAVVNRQLYALTDDGKLYRAGHSTTGDLSVRAMAIENGKERVVIVGLDLVSFNYSLGAMIKDIIQKKRNIPPQAIFLNASHTHFAPTMKEALTYGEPMQLPDSVYLNNTVKNGAVKAIEQALDNLKPSELFFTRGSTNIGHNRSSPDNETPYDNSLDVLKAVSQDGKRKDILFLTGCHPVAKNVGREGLTISANYPGVTKRLLESKGFSDHAVFIQGCGGDINPREQDHEKTGTALAFDVVAALNGEMKKISGSVSCYLDSITIPITPWSVDQVEKFKAENSGKENLDAIKNVRWANVMLGRYKNGTVPSSWLVYVQTINIGNWKLVGLSREVVTEYGIAIKSLWRDQLVSVAGYTNDVSSYLPGARHIRAKTYEGYNSFFWNAQPAILPTDVFEIVINKIKEFNR